MKLKKKLFWTINFSALTLFSVYALAGMLGFGSQQAYAATLKKDGFYTKSHNFVVVHGDADKTDKQGLEASTTDEEVCTITPTQAAELDAFFHVKFYDIKLADNSTVQVAAIRDHHLTKGELMTFLKASNESLDCQIVGIHHIFFLPVIPQIS